jgi:hypothetical protein
MGYSIQGLVAKVKDTVAIWLVYACILAIIMAEVLQ